MQARAQGLFLHALMSLSLGAWSLLVYTVLVVMQLRPPWDAQYVIPILGMLLVGALTWCGVVDSSSSARSSWIPLHGSGLGADGVMEPARMSSRVPS